jgi:hypothetical protein
MISEVQKIHMDDTRSAYQIFVGILASQMESDEIKGT